MESKKESQNEINANNIFIQPSNIQEIIELRDKLKETLPNKEKQSDILKNLEQILYHSLYENHSYKNNPEIIEDIIEYIEEFILSESSLDIINPIINTLESLMMLFLFHFDLNIIKIGFSLVKFLIDNLEPSYSNELLDYFLRIIQILNIKKNINIESSSIVASSIIYSITLSINIIISDSQIVKENKKAFYDFVKKNISDVNLIYLLFLPYANNQKKNEKIFGTEEIKFIYEKIGDDLNKTFTDLSSNLQRKKSDISFIKEKMNKIGILCRILNCVTFQGHRTYIIDKLIKNMTPLSQKIIELMNEFREMNNPELKFPAETIENIFCYFISLGVFSFETLLRSICFINKMFNDYSNEYLSIVIYLIEEIEKIYNNLEANDNKKNKLIFLIAQIIEIALQKNKDRNNGEIRFDIYELYILTKIYQILLKISPNFSSPINKFPNITKFFIEDKDKNHFEEMPKGFNKNNYDYQSQIYLNCISAGNKANNMINKQCFINVFNKFIDFKNSMKEPLAIKDESEMDKSIEKEKKEIISKQNISPDEFKNFFLKNSMEMFNEICKSEK